MEKPKSVKTPNGFFAILVAFFLIVQVFPSGQSRAANDVDLLLLLALDVSASINNTEYDLMSKGLAKALLSRQLGDAIVSGKHGAIAISVVQWSGFQEQVVKIDWVRVANQNDLKQLSARIAKMSRRYKGGATDIGGAIKYTRELMEKAPFSAQRRVIDIAGDGTNNVNRSPSFERDITVKSGITINGLAVVGEAVTLVDFYGQYVIGGDLAFVEEARDYDSFQTAMRRKLVREIASQYLF